MATSSTKKKTSPKKKDAQTESQNPLPSNQIKSEQGLDVKDPIARQIIQHFGNQIKGIALLPATAPAKDSPATMIVLLDEVASAAKEQETVKLQRLLGSNYTAQVVTTAELWQSCCNGDYTMLRTIASAQPVFDTPTLASIRICEYHKTMVLQKFDKYIVSYVLIGSIPQGRSTAASDIDVLIVIDDTDVKQMSRLELRDRLRGTIAAMGEKAAHDTHVTNHFSCQVHILTDFWDSVREVNPVIFTFLRYGVPFYDRNIFMIWKRLLLKGELRPSLDSIDRFMNTGEQYLQNAQKQLQDISTNDFFHSIILPSQSAIMLYGLTPPLPQQTARMFREIFVEKEHLISAAHVNILDKITALRLRSAKGMTVSGKEIQDLLKESTAFLQELKILMGKIELLKERKKKT